MDPGDRDDLQGDPTGRVFQLLGLLQSHRRWTSTELADSLGITARTVRRDIDRLRRLGYPVEAVPGATGGYRLAAGAHLPPLMFDDDEAVAIAVGLWTATSSPLAGIEDTALRALAKLETLLPDRLRRRMTAIGASTSIHRWSHGAEHDRTDIETLMTITAACRDSEEIRFSYVDRSGSSTDRLVEPHRLVAIDERWYLLAWDLRRDAWRTFRTDRVASVRAAGRQFTPRRIPGGDPGSFVADRLGRAPQAHTVAVTVDADRDAVITAIPWLADDTVPLEGGRAEVTLRANRIEQLAVGIARLAGSFDVDLPPDTSPELLDRIRSMSDRLGRTTP